MCSNQSTFSSLPTQYKRQYYASQSTDGRSYRYWKTKKKEYLSLIDVSRNYNWKLNGNFFTNLVCWAKYRKIVFDEGTTWKIILKISERDQGINEHTMRGLRWISWRDNSPEWLLQFDSATWNPRQQWVCFTVPSDWSRILTQLSKPIRWFALNNFLMKLCDWSKKITLLSKPIRFKI